MIPQRIQRKRTKGWRMPEGAVYVGRPTKWGNPWYVAGRDVRLAGVDNEIQWATGCADAAGEAASAFYRWLDYHYPGMPLLDGRRFWILRNLSELAGRDLVCWCPLDRPCHGDVLLAMAKRETP